MPQTVSLYRWDELALEKVTEMISRKIVTGEREMLAQIYLKKGAIVPMHNHERADDVRAPGRAHIPDQRRGNHRA
jgi:hypothetical protein